MTSFESSRGGLPPAACILIALLLFVTCTTFVTGAWAVQSFYTGVFLLLAAGSVIHYFQPLSVDFDSHTISALGVGLLPFYGLFQLAVHSTVSRPETRAAVLHWGALAGVFFLARHFAHLPRCRARLLSVFLWFATALAALCLLQLFTSHGRVFWLFDSGYPDVYGTFPYYNNYAQFVELALPLALWRAQSEGNQRWWVLGAGVLYASVIASTSRAGSILCTAELLVLPGAVFFQPGRRHQSASQVNRASVLLLIPAVAMALSCLAGWEKTWSRFQQREPYTVRGELAAAAVNMTRERPWIGFGLGTYPLVYPAHAQKELGVYANHAHNDWAEFAAEGGVPFLLLVLLPICLLAPRIVKRPWALGILSVSIHACVDYPFPRPGVSAWFYLILGMV